MSIGGGLDDFAMPEEHKEKKPVGKLFLTLFGVFFFLILITFFISFTINNKNISQRDLYKGEVFDLKDNESLRFKFEKERHNVQVRILGASSAEITVSSESVTKKIDLNESAFFDLNNDSENDFRVWLLDINNYKAFVEFKRVDEGFCNPDWHCAKWGSCIDGLRKRTCEDLNRCGREDSIPEIEVFCSSILLPEHEIPEIPEIPENDSSFENTTQLIIEPNIFLGNGELNCVDNGGHHCLEKQRCDGNWINSSDSLRCCYGECYSANFDLSGENSSIVCDSSISSFRTAVSNCTLFSMGCVENILLFELGVIQGFESTFEIKGYAPGNKCIFEYSYGNVFINYTSEKYLSLLDEGMSSPQINFQLETLEREHVNKFQDKSILCEYPQNEFLTFARSWEDEEISWTKDILGKYECQGDLPLY